LAAGMAVIIDGSNERHGDLLGDHIGDHVLKPSDEPIARQKPSPITGTDIPHGRNAESLNIPDGPRFQ
jgi:hypothetical protein